MTATADVTAPPARPTPPSARRRRTQRRRELLQLTSTIPALLWFLVFTVGPLVSLFYFSTVNWRGLIAPRTPAGLTNFEKLFTDPIVGLAAWNTFLQLVITLPIVVLGAFMIAYYLTLKPRGHRFIRALMFTPVLLAASALAMVFVGVFAPQGMINGFLKAVGLSDLARPWLADGTTAFWAIIIVTIWCSMSVSAVMLAARLNSIDESIFEAAEIDGAGHWRRMWAIAWPMSREFIGVVTMLQFLSMLFNSAQNVLLLTQGGPGTSTTTLAYLIYQKAFVEADLGYSQAVGVILFVIGLLGMGAIRRVLRATH